MWLDALFLLRKRALLFPMIAGKPVDEHAYNQYNHNEIITWSYLCRRIIMKTLTIHGIDPELVRNIKEREQQSELSVNQYGI